MPECKLKELIIYFFPVDSFAAAAKRFSKVVKNIKEKKKTNSGKNVYFPSRNSGFCNLASFSAIANIRFSGGQALLLYSQILPLFP